MSSTLLRPAEFLQSRPQTQRGTYFVQTWGCQMNEEDSEQMASCLQQIGFSPAADLASAQVILLNTCSVRKKPEDKAFSMLGEIAILKRSRPEIIVGVCGCMAQLRAKEIKQRAPHVDFVVGTAQIAAIPGLVEEALQSRRFATRLDLPERKGSVVTDIPTRNSARTAKLKCFVPIQYGCDKFCSFCIVPTTRGRERSRPVEEIVTEVTRLAEQGTREVTLLGQTVNSYGKNLEGGRVSFSELLWRLNDIPGLERIRYTSPYPRDFRADLIETIRDCPKVMEHVHMPMQSGDNEILKAMRRLYTRESFLKIVSDLRQAIPQVSITTDIIVGFPGETEAQFESTLSLVEEVGFDGSYMFIYSPRPGTPATDMAQFTQAEKQARLARLKELQDRLTKGAHTRMIGNTYEVLVEGPSPKNPDLMQGYTREFRMTHFQAPKDTIGQLVKVKAVQAHLWGCTAELA